MQHHKRLMFYQERDLWEDVQRSRRRCQRQLLQPAQSGHQHPVRCESSEKQPCGSPSVITDRNVHGYIPAPCQPRRIRSNLDCVTNSAWVSWDAAAGADGYFVSAVGGEGSTANCSTSSNTTCEVEELVCGVLYHINVVARNSNCDSLSSETINLATGIRLVCDFCVEEVTKNNIVRAAVSVTTPVCFLAPCSLSGVTAVSECHNSTILVMWDVMEASEGNAVYSATAEARDRTYLSCNITGTSCYLHGAQCDSRYSIIVSASSDQCSSLRSPPYRMSTGEPRLSFIVLHC